MDRLMWAVVVLAAGAVIGAAAGALRAAELVIDRPARREAPLDPEWQCPDFIPEELS